MVGIKGRIVEFWTRPEWDRRDWFATVILLGVFIWWISPVLFPTSQAYRLESVRIDDSVQGEQIGLVAVRQVRKDTFLKYQVDVREVETNLPMCFAERWRLYEKPAGGGVVLSKTLEWWAWSEDGDCVKWIPQAAPGSYIARTRHCWKRFAWARLVCNPWTPSNIFQIKSREEN